MQDNEDRHRTSGKVDVLVRGRSRQRSCSLRSLPADLDAQSPENLSSKQIKEHQVASEAQLDELCSTHVHADCEA